MSADVFGLSATHDLGIGQHPARVGTIVDAIYPMTYPSHYTSGEFNLTDPNAEPGQTVMFSLRDFRRELAGGKALLVPWLQDFSLGRTYTAADVEAQIASAPDRADRRLHALERRRALHRRRAARRAAAAAAGAPGAPALGGGCIGSIRPCTRLW